MTSRDGTATWQRSALRWFPTFVGFPLGGFAAELIAGPVDGRVAYLWAPALSALWALGWAPVLLAARARESAS